MDIIDNNPSIKRNGSCTISALAKSNPFMKYGNYTNLNNSNAGVKWSIIDPNNLVKSATYAQKRLLN